MKKEITTINLLFDKALLVPNKFKIPLRSHFLIFVATILISLENTFMQFEIFQNHFSTQYTIALYASLFFGIGDIMMNLQSDGYTKDSINNLKIFLNKNGYKFQDSDSNILSSKSLMLKKLTKEKSDYILSDIRTYNPDTTKVQIVLEKI